MNKETKVGLLVGLSFIVLFGVILSGRAPDMPSTPEKTMVSQAPHRRTDNVQVVRRIELPEELPVPGPGQVDAADLTGSDNTTAAHEQPAPADNPVAQTPQQPATPNDSTTAAKPQADEPDTAEIVMMDPVADPHSSDAEPNGDDVVATARTNLDGTEMVAYTIKKGDTLARIARNLCGNDSNKTIDLIYNANRDKMASKSACVVGRTLQIPVVKKDRNTETLLKSGKFEEISHGRPGKSQGADPVVEDSTGDSETVKTTEAAKPANKAAPKDARSAPKNGIKAQPKDALAQYIEEVTEEAVVETSRQTITSMNTSTLKTGGNSDPKGELAEAIDRVTQEVTAGEPGLNETPATPPSTVALAVERQNLRHYQVQKGDTWYKMAARFMGNASRWKELYALNDDIVPDATKLRTGVKIRVPAN